MPQSSTDETVLFVNPKSQTTNQVTPDPVAPQQTSPTPINLESQPEITSNFSNENPIENPPASVQQFSSEEFVPQPPQPQSLPDEPSASTSAQPTIEYPQSVTDTAPPMTEDEVSAQPTSTELTSADTITLHQPVALLIVRIVSIGIVYFFTLWLLQRVLAFMVQNFPELMPGFVSPDFMDSKIFIWGLIFFIFIAIGIGLKWWSIYFVISPTEVVVHSGIVIKQAQVLKRIGISVRQIELKRTLLGMLLKYVTIEIGSEILGGVSMTIGDNQKNLDTITSALQPGEMKQTKKIL